MTPIILMWCLGLVNGQCTQEGNLPLSTPEQCFRGREIVLDEALTDGYKDNHAKCVTIVEITPKENKDAE